MALKKMLARHDERNPKDSPLPFMISPPATKAPPTIASSWLPLPLKLYYNPANLEKVGCRVKQKEFIHAVRPA